MTYDEIRAALLRGNCSEAKARESGCAMCCAAYDALDEVRRMFETCDGLEHLAVQRGQLLLEAEEEIAHLRGLLAAAAVPLRSEP